VQTLIGIHVQLIDECLGHHRSCKLPTVTVLKMQTKSRMVQLTTTENAMLAIIFNYGI